ncbi:MAG: hypothetical protein N4A61_14165 [Pelagimonas sp.]|nr:hypothetical protein [Pelagimonas sp.]
MFFFTIFASIMLGAVAYLQFDARWWTGILTSLGLFAAEVASSMLLVVKPGGLNGDEPVLGITTALGGSAILVGVGVVVTLILRPFFSRTKVVSFCFFSGLLTLNILALV